MWATLHFADGGFHTPYEQFRHDERSCADDAEQQGSGCAYSKAAFEYSLASMATLLLFQIPVPPRA
jgi:hypothetical protein